MAIIKKFIIYSLKGLFGFFELILAFIVVMILYIIIDSRIFPPEIEDIKIGERKKIGENHYVLGENWLKKNKFGIWEMYIEGGAYERGLVYGKLAKELVQKQEKIFVEQIDHFVPSQVWQQFLRLMIGFFNRDLPSNIPLENQKEIYGVSQSFSDDYDYISSKYARILNYHAAHDIGHALNDYSMVGCTSFALKDEMSDDGKLLVGRNFDFYVGDEFAEEKIVLFIKPDNGHAFVSYSWAGFTGVVSGLNSEGLSVTINAAKSDLPKSSKTPISILAREILQYAKNIEEAIAIAKKRKTFVSESILISSKNDRRAVIIEKSPSKMGVFSPGTSSVVCANHYQSDTFIKDKVNKDNIKNSDSKFRYDRVEELLSKRKEFTIPNAVELLRDQLGENDEILGIGNPRAINQLIAHHSVVIRPEASDFYISTQDFQLGEYLGYNLKDVMNTKKTDSLKIISEDPFINSETYHHFKEYRATRKSISEFLNFAKPLVLKEKDIEKFISMNPELYNTYEMLGRYFKKKKDYKSAKKYFSVALTKNVASKEIEDELKILIKKCGH